MAFGDLVTAPIQIELWRSDAQRLLMGLGTKFKVSELRGFSGAPIRSATSAKIGAHGGHTGHDYADPNAIGGGFSLVATSEADLATQKDALNAFFFPDDPDQDVIVTARLLGWSAPRYVTGRATRLEYAIGPAEKSGYAVLGAAFEILAHEPKWYALALTTNSFQLPASDLDEQLAVTNNGKVSTEPTIEITGPGNNDWIIENVTTGKILTSARNRSAGDKHVIDMKAQTIKDQAGASLYSFLRLDQTEWWALAPGANTVRVRRAAGALSDSGIATVDVKFRDAWN